MIDEVPPSILLCQLGFKYWHVSENVIQEMLKTGNIHTVTGTEEISNELYDQTTRWSDFNVAIPVLFNFYHGIELNLKGLISAGGGDVPKTHRLTDLYELLKQHCDKAEILSFFHTHLHVDTQPDILRSFYDTNSISPDDYYIALKYPYAKEGENYIFFPLRYNEEAGCELFSGLRESTLGIRSPIVQFVRERANAA